MAYCFPLPTNGKWIFFTEWEDDFFFCSCKIWSWNLLPWFLRDMLKNRYRNAIHAFRLSMRLPWQDPIDFEGRWKLGCFWHRQRNKQRGYYSITIGGGGHSKIFDFHPENWGRFPIWLQQYFLDGLKPPTRLYTCFIVVHHRTSFFISSLGFTGAFHTQHWSSILWGNRNTELMTLTKTNEFYNLETGSPFVGHPRT